MGFLRRRGYHDTLAAFELESGVNESAIGENLAYLKRLILSGRWDDATSYLTPLKHQVPNFVRTEFLLRRQQFLEALSWHGAGGHPKWSLAWSPHHDGLGNGQSMDAVVSLLKNMEGTCSAPEFDSLCLCLTLEDIRDNADFSTWSVSTGRLECFEALRGAVGNLVEGENTAPSNYPGLETHIGMGLEAQSAFAGAAAGAVTFKDGIVCLGDVLLKRSELPNLSLIAPSGAGGEGTTGRGGVGEVNLRSSGTIAAQTPLSAPASPAKGVANGSQNSNANANPIRGGSHAPSTAVSVSQELKIKPRAPVSWTVGLDDERDNALPPAPMLSHGRPHVPGSPTRSTGSMNTSVAASVAATDAMSEAAAAPSAHKVFQMDQPIRCIVGMDSGSAYSDRAGEVTMAVGCNDKCLRVLSWEQTVGMSVVAEFSGANKGSVYGVDYLPDGEVIATCSNEKSIRLFAPRRNHAGQPMVGHTGTVRAVKFAPTSGSSGMVLASAGAGDFRPRIWDAKTETCVFMAEAHERTVHGVAWYDPNTVLTGCESGQIIATDVRMSQRAFAMHVLGANDGLARSICSLDSLGDLITLGTPSGCLDIVSMSQRAPLVQTKLHSSDVRCVAFRKPWGGGEAQYPLDLLVGSFDGSASLTRVGPSVTTGKMHLQKQKSLLQHTDKVLGAAWVPGDASRGHAVTTGADGCVFLWK